MKLNQRILPLLTLLLFGICRHSAAQEKIPDIVILATGGTLAGVAATGTRAGYTSGAVTTDLATVPDIKNLANIKGKQISGHHADPR
jgi:L-asparaginase